MAAVTLKKIEKTSIINIADVSTAREIIRKMASEAGFCPKTAEELTLVTTELAKNILRHAGQGQMIFSVLFAEGPLIQIETFDKGPGIPDIEQAISDGFSTSGSLGYGLGTVNRLMDTLEIETVPGITNGGTHVLCRRRLPVSGVPPAACPFDIGIATRPCAGYSINGDAFISEWNNGSLLVGVIDGLGHGQFAHHASEKIRHYVIDHAHLSLDLIFQGAGRASRASRGAVMTLARLTVHNAATTLSHIALGNIETRIIGEKNQILPISRGILGKNRIIPKIHRQQLNRSESLILFSDGVSSRWHTEFNDLFNNRPAEEIAATILKQLGRDTDDATCVVVKQRTRGACR